MEFLVDEKIGGRKHPLLKWAKDKLELCFGTYPVLGRCGGYCEKYQIPKIKNNYLMAEAGCGFEPVSGSCTKSKEILK